MRVLALDPGTRRIGLALSDPLGIIAQPAGSVPAEPAADALARIGELVREHGVELLLVGLPRNMDGSYGPAADRVRQFVSDLEAAVSVPVRTWDERLTTAQAQRVMIEGGARRDERRQKIDSLAAAILLQSYLDAQS